ncbi:MAG: hypothetical protein GF347_02290 [Candidatus Moranbacteria bacterium]|nr:hypothetical protein [Candidatus Moranbacteria bacterium]
MRKKQTFAGDKKKGGSILYNWEQKMVGKVLPYIPKRIETYHLTYSTMIWSSLIVFSGFLSAKYSLNWLWLSSVMIVFQYITDLLDGKLGKYRNTGLIKWGYYMDHFLDYFFLCSILISYSFIIPQEKEIMLFFILAILGGYMVNSYLAFAATNEFKISYLKIGPTEVRILFIVINTLFIVFGKTYLAFTLPASLILSTAGLIFVVYRTQKYIWRLDMEEKTRLSSRSGRTGGGL